MNGRKATFVLVLAAMLVLALGVRPAAAQDSVQMDFEFGVGGFVAPKEPNPVRVSITADILIVGDLVISIGRTTVSTPIEVPAGTTKNYTLQFPPVAGGSPKAQIRNDRGDVVVESRTTARVPFDEIVTGVVGNPALVTAVSALTSKPFEIDVVGVAVDDATLAADFGVLDYLILQDPPAQSAAEAVQRWVEGGGRLIGTAEAVASVGLPVRAGAVERVGNGTVTIDSLTNDSIGDLALTSVPPATFTSGAEQQSQLESTLFEAASSGGAAEDLRFGWLVGALIIYVVVVGPLNFLLLARLNRRDWAWVTVPLLSVGGMLAFWAVGRADAGVIDVRHASVLIQEGSTIRAETGLIVAGGTAGEHRISLTDPATLTPFDAAQWFGGGGRTETELRVDGRGETELAFQLATLGLGAARASWTPPPLGVSVADDSVTNKTDWDFKTWGVRTPDGFMISNGSLAAGATAAIGDVNSRIPDLMFAQSPIAEAFFNAPVARFDETEQVIWPLSWAATQIHEPLLRGGTYFFGFTDDFNIPVIADGADTTATGRSLVVIATGGPADDPGSAPAELLAAPGADWIEDYGPTFVYGADSVAVRFTLPDASSRELRLDSVGGPQLPEEVVVYNWETGQLDPLMIREPFQSRPYTSPSGEVMVQLVSGSPEGEVYVDALRLEWGSA